MTDDDLPAIGAACLELLAAQSFFAAASEPAIIQLGRALQRGCASLPHVRAVLEAWTAQNPGMPAPADLLALAQRVPDPAGQSAAPCRPVNPDCPKCGGTGWSTLYFLRTYMLTELGWRLNSSEWITRERYDELVRTVDGNEQEVAEAAAPCGACRGAA